MIEYKDGSVLAQLGRPDMRVPIQYALDYPVRHAAPWERLDLRGKSLTFLEPEWDRFPALQIAYVAGKRGGTLPAAMNAANEIAVDAFLKERISFPKILDTVIQVSEEHTIVDHPDLAEILRADDWARQRAFELTAQ